MSEGYQFTRPFTLTCPECGGAMFPPEVGAVLRYACHIGHVLSWPTMVQAHTARIEATLGAALVLLKERAELATQLVGQPGVDADTLLRMRAEALERAGLIKELLEGEWPQPQA